jgi:hypothetical protein
MGWTNEQLILEGDRLLALENATRIARLRIYAELDRRKAFEEDGSPCMADWVTYRYGKSPLKAREEIRTGHALDELPKVCENASDGLLPWEKVTQITSFATADEDEHIAEVAIGMSYAELRDVARVARRVRREEAERAIDARYVRMRWDPDESALRLAARIPGADGAAVKAALDRLTDRLDPDSPVGWEPRARKRADALVELAVTSLADDADTHRATAVIHVDARDLNHVNGKAQLEGGAIVPSEVARRLSCDGRIEVVTEGPDGTPIGIGRRSRIVPPWMIRELKRRDRGCVNCGNTSNLHAHHITHWAHGGRTDLSNLVLLCWKCHRLVHDRGFKLIRDGTGTLRLLRPDGRPVVRYGSRLGPPIHGPPSRVG